MKFHLDYTHGIYVGSTFEIAETPVFGDLLDAMLAHEAWQPGNPWIHNHTDLIVSEMSAGDIQGIADLCMERSEQIGASKCAIVVPEDLHYGLSRMWASVVDLGWQADAGVYRNHEDAVAWVRSGAS